MRASNQELGDLLDTALELAREAGDVTLRHFGKVHLWLKPGGGFQPEVE